jgi:aminocarboxymuconate-semialdehyde decarboxylase
MVHGEITDMHAHVYPEGCLAEIVKARPDFSLDSSARGQSLAYRGSYVMSIPSGQGDLKKRLQVMDDAGVGIQVLSVGALNLGWAGSRDLVTARTINDGLAAVCREFPRRFQFVAALPSSSHGALESELDRALALGALGVGITTTVGDYTLDAPELREFWRALNRRKLLVLVHPTFPPNGPAQDRGEFLAVGYLGETAMAATKLILAGVLEECSDVRLVWSHCGGSLSVVIDRIDRGYKRHESCPRPPSEYLRRCFYDTASMHGPALDCARATFGTSALVYGTDEPHVPNGTRAVLDALRGRRWSEDELEAVLSRNARDLLQRAADQQQKEK